MTVIDKPKQASLVFFHILFWSIYIPFDSFIYFNILPEKLNLNNLLDTVCAGLGIVAIFYCLIVYVHPILLGKRQYFKSAVLIVFFYFVYAMMRYGIKLGLQDPPPGASTHELNSKHFFVCFAYYLQFFLYSGGYWVARQAVKRNKALELAEKERLSLENKFLKAQINPHFLYNTLSLFYTRSLKYDTELADAIVTLTQIMRYSIENGMDKSGDVPLAAELTHVKNLIKINQLRYGNKLNIKYSEEGDIIGYSIIPHALITFVENAFKYGDLANPDFPVQIMLKINESELFFRVVNKIRSGPAVQSDGIGLENTRKRLQFAYGERQSIQIERKNDIFEISITIKQPLHDKLLSPG